MDDGDEEYRVQIRRLWLPAVTIGIAIAGERLCHLCCEAEYETSVAAGRLWLGGNRLSAERWVFWRERFAVLAGMEGVEVEGSELARIAVARMAELGPGERGEIEWTVV